MYQDKRCSLCGRRIKNIPLSLYLYNPVVCSECAGALFIENEVRFYERGAEIKDVKSCDL